MNFQPDDPKSGGGEYFGSSPYAGGADEYTGGAVFSGILRGARTDLKWMALAEALMIIFLIVIMILTATGSSVPREVIIFASIFGGLSLFLEAYSWIWYTKDEWREEMPVGDTAKVRREMEKIRAKAREKGINLDETA